MEPIKQPEKVHRHGVRRLRAFFYRRLNQPRTVSAPPSWVCLVAGVGLESEAEYSANYPKQNQNC